MVSNCPWCQIVCGVKLSAVSPKPCLVKRSSNLDYYFITVLEMHFYDGGALIFLWFKVSFDDVKVKEVVCICFRGFLWASSNFWKWESTRPFFLKKEGFSGFLLNNIYAFLFFSWARHYVRMNLSSVQFHFLWHARWTWWVCYFVHVIVSASVYLCFAHSPQIHFLLERDTMSD